MSMPIFANFELEGLLTVQIKDGRYRAIIENINHVGFDKSLTRSEAFFLKNRNSEFKGAKNLLATLFYMDKHFQDVFAAKETVVNEDW